MSIHLPPREIEIWREKCWACTPDTPALFLLFFCSTWIRSPRFDEESTKNKETLRQHTVEQLCVINRRQGSIIPRDIDGSYGIAQETMSDSDDSDFGAMRAKAKNKIRRATPLVHRQNSNVANDSDDEDDILVLSSRKKQKVDVDQKLARWDHKRKITQRNRQNLLKGNDSSSDDDDDDSGDEKRPIQVQEPIPVRGTPQGSPHVSPSRLPPSGGTRRSTRLQNNQSSVPVAPADASRKRPPLPKAQAAPKQPIAKQATQEEIYISSDEDETSSFSAENNQQLIQLRLARARLLAQHRPVDVNEECAEPDSTESPRNQILQIVVDATVDRDGTSSEKRESITFYLPAAEKLAVLEQSLLRELKLPADSSTICKLRCGSKILRGDRTASYYDLESPSNVHASIFLTSWGSNGASSSGQNYGPSLQLILRKGQTKTNVTYGLNQPFKQLIDDHGVLQFDGERISPNSTPASYGTYFAMVIGFLWR